VAARILFISDNWYVIVNIMPRITWQLGLYKVHFTVNLKVILEIKTFNSFKNHTIHATVKVNCTPNRPVGPEEG
jgi:hypothetical protein